MDTEERDTLLEQLSWDADATLQQQAIAALAGEGAKSLPYVMQRGDKSRWENQAKVIQEVGYPHVSACLPQLLEWLQDLNWPGATTILNVLARAPREELSTHLRTALESAESAEDDLWIDGLEQLLAAVGMTRP